MAEVLASGVYIPNSARQISEVFPTSDALRVSRMESVSCPYADDAQSALSKAASVFGHVDTLEWVGTCLSHSTGD